MIPTRAISDRLLDVALALYGVVLLIAFVIFVVRAVPESSIPVLTALGGFLGTAATFLLTLREWLQRRDPDRL